MIPPAVQGEQGTSGSPVTYRYPGVQPGYVFLATAFLLLLSSSFGLASTPCPPATVQVLEDDRLFPALMSLIQKANEEVWIGAFHLKTGVHPDSPPDQLLAQLLMAGRRGVRVHVLLEKPEDPRSELARENEKSAARLKKSGIPVYWDRGDRRSHMKVAVVDGRFAIVGSHNLTTSALRYNHEMSVLLDSPCIAQQTIQYLHGIVREAGGTPPR